MNKSVTTKVACLGAVLCFAGCSSDGGSGGPADPAAACKAVVHVTCQKFYGCFTGAQLAAAASLVGTTEAECETKFTDCSEGATKCDAGQTYHADTANSCINSTQALTCNDLLSFANGTTAVPTACTEICK